MNLNSKEDYINLIKKLCNPLLKYYDETKSSVVFPNRLNACYENYIADIESFSRPLWALNILAKKDKKLMETIFKMIKNGTNKDSIYYWGILNDFDQRLVEMTSIAFFIYDNKDYFYKNFSEKEIKNVNDWFNLANKIDCFKSNWLLFQMLINTLLKKLNLNYNNEIIEKNFNLLNGQYIGDGWYNDGYTNQRDYYIEWLYHFFLMLLIYIDKDYIHKDIIINRAIEFSKSFIYLTSEDGSLIPYGRSLIYRFGQTAFWGMYALLGLKNIEISVVKGIINRNIRYFIDKDIYRTDGILNTGYIYQNFIITDFYNSTSSQYWCFITFIFMLLDKDNIFFKTKESNLPKLQNKIYFDKPQFLITRTKDNVSLFPINSNSFNDYGNTIAKYERIVYSTKFAFNMSIDNTSLKNKALDNTYAVYYNNNFIEKHNTKDKIINNNIIKSVFKPLKFTKITSYIIPVNEWHIRIFKISSLRNFSLYDFGYSISRDDSNIIKKDNEIILTNDETKQVSIIKRYYSSGIIDSYNPYTNVNLLYPRTLTPYTIYKIKKGFYLIIDCVYGGNKLNKDCPNIDIKLNKINITYKDINFNINKSFKCKYSNIMKYEDLINKPYFLEKVNYLKNKKYKDIDKEYISKKEYILIKLLKYNKFIALKIYDLLFNIKRMKDRS